MKPPVLRTFLQDLLSCLLSPFALGMPSGSSSAPFCGTDSLSGPPPQVSLLLADLRPSFLPNLCPTNKLWVSIPCTSYLETCSSQALWGQSVGGRDRQGLGDCLPPLPESVMAFAEGQSSAGDESLKPNSSKAKCSLGRILQPAAGG